MDNRPIGVFDSGIGGLTVVNSLISHIPSETIYYVGDTGRVPYGNKSSSNIKNYSEEIVSWLVKEDCKMVVVACNTASSIAINHLKKHFSIPILGVIDPGVNYAMNITKNGNIGVIGTEATIRSNAYGEKIKSLDSNIQISGKACPLFVPLVEEGLTKGEIPYLIAYSYLKDLLKTNIDTVILGCTHYPMLKSVISKVLGKNVELVDSAEMVAKEVLNNLKKYNLSADETKKNIHFHVTDSADLFCNLASKFLNIKKLSIKRIEL